MIKFERYIILFGNMQLHFQLFYTFVCKYLLMDVICLSLIHTILSGCSKPDNIPIPLVREHYNHRQ